jgi:membrane-associated phospholipid phosphatase
MGKILPTVSQEHFSRRRLIFHWTLVLITICLAGLTYFAKKDPYFGFDLVITQSIQQIQSPVFLSLMKAVSFIGEPVQGIVLALVASGVIFLLGREVDAFLCLFSVSGIEVIGLILKSLVSRARPDPTLIHQLSSHFSGGSFPSGHVLYFIGLFGFLLFLGYTIPPKHVYRNLFLGICILLLILIGPSRIYLGAHWFSDVLGAYLIGSLWLTFIIFIHHKIQPIPRGRQNRAV